MQDTGIASIGLKLPTLAMHVDELARLRGIDPKKFTVGLGLEEMALCDDGWDAARLGAEAAERALARWGGDRSRIGLVAVGTETAKDMSRPLSAFIMETLGMRGHVRSYEVKHACYGGTLALRQALEWRASGANAGKAALVIATDVALYALLDGGEPTQGAGAVAFVIDAPLVARVDIETFPYASPAFDFWRPVGQSFPSVDGQLSLDCYKEAAVACFGELVGKRDAMATLESFRALCFHVPFPKMVVKAFGAVTESLGLDEAQASTLFRTKVDPSMVWNRRAGNCYTASLWISVAHALAGAKLGERVAAFSYGSGFGAELFGITAMDLAEAGAWKADIESDLASRTLVTAERYTALRADHVGVR
jgi:hydroxymethylglutaryl-CoA synthase